MLEIMRMAARNLLRYKRRTLLTAALITVGLVAVLLFIAVAGSFKDMMVAQFTDSMVGHMQVHRRGYLGAMESLPVDRNMRPRMLVKLYEELDNTAEIQAWSPRVKLMAMFSNFQSTTSIRLNGVDPEREAAVVPLLSNRVVAGGEREPLVKRGHVQVPELLAKPMNLKPGDTVVLVATNRDGSVNGKTFVVQGIMESISGPGGRDGYIHIDDARDLLRLDDEEVEAEVLDRHGFLPPDAKATLAQEKQTEQSLRGPAPGAAADEPAGEAARAAATVGLVEETRGLFEARGWGRPSEVSEIAIRLKDPSSLQETMVKVDAAVASLKNKKGESIFQVHPWEQFVPFSKIAKMIDLMNLFIKIILVTVVLISIMNVLIMAVYERIREIGTLSAIGTSPSKILWLFLSEGFLLGVLGTAAGIVISLVAIQILNAATVSIAFGRQENIVLAPSIAAADVVSVGLLTVLVAVLASLQPAWKASRMDPITALRHV
jgi:ABC-type lipoprotein release transport system permease subunit